MIRTIFVVAAGLALLGCQKDPVPPASTTAVASNANVAASQSELAETVLHIEGMVCQGCAEAAQGCLTGLDGVASAQVSVDDRSAHVRYDASKTTPPDMIAALEAVDRGDAPAFHVSIENTR